MKKNLFLAFLSLILLNWSCSSNDDHSDPEYEVVAYTGQVKNVKIISATIEGRANIQWAEEENVDVYTAGMEYSNTKDFAQVYRLPVKESAPTSFSFNIMCVPQTTYYYRTYVNINEHYYYGKTKSFTTQSFTNIAQTGEVRATNYTHATVLMSVDENLQEPEFLGSIISGRTYGAATRDEIFHDVAIFYSQDRQALEKFVAGDTSESKKIQIFQRALNANNYTSIKKEEGLREFLVTLNNIEPNTLLYYCAGTLVYSKKNIQASVYHGGEIKSLRTQPIDALTIDTYDAQNISFIWGDIPWAAAPDITQDVTNYDQRCGILYSTSRKDVEAYTGTFLYVTATEKNDTAFILNMNPIQLKTTYYYRSFARFGSKCIYGPIKSFTTLSPEDISTGESIDLGLSCKWRNCNLGAELPEQIGNYYQWSKTDTYDVTSSSTNGNLIQFESVPTHISGKSTYDPVTKTLGQQWQMPSKAQMEELCNNCLWLNVTLKGQEGYILVGPNQHSIFLPLTGCINESGKLRNLDGIYYWSGDSDYKYNAFTLTSPTEIIKYYYTYGCAIRPVYVEK